MHDFKNILQEKTPLHFLYAASKPYKWQVFGALAVSGFSSAVGSFTPLVYKKIVDAITAADSTQIYLWVIAYIALYAFGTLSWRVMSVFGSRWSVGVRHTARHRLTAYILGHSHQYYENRFAGSVANKINHASESSRSIVESVMFDFWPLAISFVVSLYLTYTTNHMLAGIFVAWLGLTVPINYLLAKKRMIHTLQTQELETGLRGMTVDILGNIRAVADYARERHEMAALGDAMEERRRVGVKDWMMGEKMIGINGLMQSVFMLAMLVLSVHLAVVGTITFSSVILILSLIVGMAQSIFFIGQRISGLAEQWGEMKEGLDDLLVPYDIPNAPGARELSVDFGSVAFTHASFAYPDGSDVLQNFSLTIAPTEKVGIVGRSGAGKSTLIKLLLRHYDVTNGAVLIDGHNITDVTQESIRSAVAAVPQEPLLFHRTIRENIAYGKPDATQEEVVAAATLAHAHEFIERLPMQYETQVGERGVKLSGGERQRVALARAILKPAKILVLDEATSALDSESEAAIQDALHTLMEGKTVIAIAHRLSTLREMDRILVLEKGKIVEDGSHEELLGLGGLYAELWEYQSGGYLKSEQNEVVEFVEE